MEHPQFDRSRMQSWLLCIGIWPWLFVTGCGTVGNSQIAQLQNENDRLLAEFRAQRDEATRLRENLAVAQARLAESEKLLARQNPLPASRMSRLNEPLAPTNRSLPEATRSNSSGIANSPNLPGNPETTLQWRPMVGK